VAEKTEFFSRGVYSTLSGVSPQKIRLAGMALAASLATSVLSAGMAGQRGAEQTDRVGQPITRWQEGTLDIHQISTGQGNSAFVVMPDGTTLLIDAGGPAAGIARYIDHVLPPGASRRLDYVVITHFHGDHVGAIAELSGLLPIGKVIDRGWPDYGGQTGVRPRSDPGLTPTAANYRKFVTSRVADHSLVAERIRVGRTDQIVPIVDRSRSGDFDVRGVAANGEVWTGRGVATEMRFPALATPDPDLPWENICSIGLRIRYGRFDFFTGGDMYGIPDPGTPSWIDLETAVARAIGPTDVHVVNMHGSISVENPAFLTTLRSRVIVLPSWSATHPSADVLKRVMAPRAYPGPRDVFATILREPTRLALGARADQLAGVGHIVVRVAKGGAGYRVVVADESTESLTVKSIKGPYESQ
jgi:beta-lactamase superfamily II metal-dependent hydrolase